VKTYHGKRVHGVPVVSVAHDADGSTFYLTPAASVALHRVRHFGHFDHFDWGGSGHTGDATAQLALALLLDATGDPARALAQYHAFKWDVVSQWQGEWKITDIEIQGWLLGIPVPAIAEGGVA